MKESLKIGHFTYLIHLDVTLSLTDAPFTKRDYKDDFLFLMTVGFKNTTLFQIIRKEDRVQVKKEFSSSSVIQVKQHS